MGAIADTDGRRLHPSGRVDHDLNRRPSVRRQLRVLRLCVLRQQRRSGRYRWWRISTADGDTIDVNDTRYFYSAYVVLDITDPDATPTVLGVYSSSDLGLTTSYPTVARMNLSSDGNTTHTNSKWFMVFGSGVHGYDGRAAATATMFAVELGAPLGTAPTVTKMPVGSWSSFMADPITLDRDLDFRSDAIYVGRTIDPASSGIGYWTGKMYRLTMGTCSAAPCSTSTWGIASGASRTPTEMLDTFNTSTELGLSRPYDLESNGHLG